MMTKDIIKSEVRFLKCIHIDLVMEYDNNINKNIKYVLNYISERIEYLESKLI